MAEMSSLEKRFEIFSSQSDDCYAPSVMRIILDYEFGDEMIMTILIMIIIITMIMFDDDDDNC